MESCDKNPLAEKGSYTLDFDDVVKQERVYLEQRRRLNELPSFENEPNTWGLAFSGGGVRSATFCLGVIQALTKAEYMTRFDYLSTVSGGGYIGSCLSSLLSHDDETALDEENSPFSKLRDLAEYTDCEDTELSVRHQIHHLRTHGAYLIPRFRILGRDVQRAIGSVLPGAFHTIFLFGLLFLALVAGIQLIATGFDRDLEHLSPAGPLAIEGRETATKLDFTTEITKAWVTQRIIPPFRTLRAATRDCWFELVCVLGLGFLWCAAAVNRAIQSAATFKHVDHFPNCATRSGWTPQEQFEWKFVKLFNIRSVIFVLGLMTWVGIFCRPEGTSALFLTPLMVPIAFALGGIFSSHILTHSLQTSLPRRAWDAGSGVDESRLRRSLFGSIRGACIYGVIVSVLAPTFFLVLFSLDKLPFKFFWSLVALVMAYLGSRSGAGDGLKPRDPRTVTLVNCAVFFFLALAFAQVSAWLVKSYRYIDPGLIPLFSLALAVTAIGLFVVFGVMVNINRVSPHYFYRDRLTEAYLKTDARCTRPENDGQGMPLTVLRDCEDLKLSDLGAGNCRGPYHLIVAALNLAGSKELNRKSFLSEHFVFSRNHIGSRVTGWADTKVYRSGKTRLARAMTISAAAVGSAMGQNTFLAQAFVTTLLNARLGFWTDNPWFYRHGQPSNGHLGFTLWPTYLLREAFGCSTARTKRVNVSDGGHTGDNLGLLPLLQRRCETIVVCDAEADLALCFGSFSNVVRMAYIEENIEIKIDLTSIMKRRMTCGGFEASKENVVRGRIVYPATPSEKESEGKLIYVKASIPKKDVPPHVAHYAKCRPDFPHETTADQFFDDAQFEAYRALGQRLGADAACRLSNTEGGSQDIARN